MGYRRDYISLSFRNQTDLFTVRRDLLPLATKNREMLDAVDTYAEVVAGEQKFGQVGMEYDMEDGFGGEGFVKNVGGAGGKGANAMDPKDAIIDIREYDVPYYLRVAIDKSASRVFLPLVPSKPTLSPPTAQTSASDSGTKSRPTPARSPSASSRNESLVPSQSSWRSISRRQRRLSSFPTS